MPNKFYVDGMTVSEILDLGDDVLSKLSARDLSRALRTVALAANKRMNRLLKYAYKRGEKIDRYGRRTPNYIEKLDGPGLDLHALEKTKGKKFSVGNKNRNEIYQELARAREFMAQKTSTVKGAKEVRKAREIAMFGKTREQMTKGMTKKEKRAFVKNLKEVMAQTYEQQNQFEEDYANMGLYEKDEGRRKFRELGTRILKGEDPEEVRKSIEAETTAEYEQAQEAAGGPEAFWQELLDDDKPDDGEDWKNW